MLNLRPDLLYPWPSDMSHLARRAADDASVLEALQSLDTTALRVLEVFACLHEASIDDVAAGLPEPREDVAGAIADLWARGLLWGAPPSFRIVRAAQQAFGAHPCGLSSTSHTVPDPTAVREAALEIDEDTLRPLVWEDPVAATANPLTVPRNEQPVLPRETSLILRDGAYLRPAAPRPVAEVVEPAPGASLWASIAGVRYLLTELEREPLAWHVNRGITRRAVSDRAATMAVPVDDLLVWLELAAVAGLVGGAGSTVGVTPEAATWLRSDPADMWSVLIRAWLISDRPLLQCSPEELGCLTTSSIPRTAHHRRHVLACWPQSRLDVAELRNIVGWHRPRMQEAVSQVAEFHREAEAIGLTAGGLPTAALALLPDDVTDAADCVPPADPAPSLILQPDHTVIAPASLDTDTWCLLHDVSRLESWGPVTMHRIEITRMRIAVTTRSPAQILSQLATVTRTPVPQSVEYTINDAGRGTAALVQTATIVRTSPVDADAVAELGFEQLGPQTFATELPADVVRRRLSAAGVAAMAEQDPVVAHPLEYPRTSGAPDEHAVNRMVAHLVDEPTDQSSPPPLPAADPQTVAALCQQAIHDDLRMWLEFSEGHETLTHLVEPIDLKSGHLTGWSLTAGRTVTVPLSRIGALAISP